MWFSPLLQGSVLLSSLVIRPSSDVTTTGWVASSGIIMFDMIDETSASDADYITSPALSTGSPIIMGLTSSLVAGTYTIRIRVTKSRDIGEFRVSLLNDANTQQGVSGWQVITNSYVTYELIITTTGTATRVRIEVQA